MKCPKCGTELQGGAKFCPKCGSTVSEAATENTPSANTSDGAEEKSASNEPSNAEDKTAKEPKPKKKLNKKVKIAIAAVVAIAVVGGGAALVLDMLHQQLINDVQPQLSDALSKEYDGQEELFAKNDYVNPSEYESSLDDVTDVNISDGKATGSIEATFENDSFESDAMLSFTADADGSNNLSNIKFNVDSQTTTPVAGINFDEDHDLENCDSNLHEDSNTCTVKTPADDTPWYANAKKVNVYKYAFDGKKWSYKKTSTKKNDVDDYYNEDAIIGSYHCTKKDGSYSKYVSDDPITIDSIDGGAGKVTVDIHLPFHDDYKGTEGELKVESYEANITWFGDDLVGFNVGTKDDEGNYIFMAVVFDPRNDHSLDIYRGTSKNNNVTGIQAHYDSKVTDRTTSYLDYAPVCPVGRDLTTSDLPAPLFARD